MSESSAIPTVSTGSSALQRLPLFRRLTLQTCIGLVIGTVIVGFSILTALALAEVARYQVLQLAKTNIEQMGGQMARELSSGMDHFAREIAAQSARELFRDPAAPPAALRTALDRLKALQPEFTWVALIDSDTGRVDVATGGVYEGGSVRSRPVFEEGKSKLFVGDVHDSLLLARLLPAPVNGEPLRFLDVSAPVTDPNGRIIAVLAAHISWEWAEQVREALLKPRHPSIDIMIIDKAGKVVLSPARHIPLGTPVPAFLPGGLPDAAGVVKWADGKDYITAMLPTRQSGFFPDFGWRVLVRQPLQEALRPLDYLRNSFLVAALLLAVAGAFLAWHLTRRILSPFQRLSASAAKWADGIATPENVPTSIGEIADIQAVLDRLAREKRARSNDADLRENQFVAFADLIPHMVWQADAQGRIEYVNRQWTNVLGAPDDLTLDQLTQILHPEDAACFTDAWRRSRACGEDLYASIRMAAAGSAQYRWYRIHGGAVHGQDGSINRWVGTVTDIDATMQEQERTGAALRSERQAREEAERITRMKDEFLATLSHELRTPLNAISGWSEVLSHRSHQDPMIGKASEVILRNVGIQASLINDLLDMSAVVAGKVTLDRAPVETAEAIAQTVLSLQNGAKAKRVSLVADPVAQPAVVFADGQRLSQILANLLSNAIKFTDPGGHVTVSSVVTGDAVQIDIADTGCGIAPDFLPHVFDRFRQEDASPTRKRGGMGLGLAIAKSLAELQGGTLRAASRGVGQGSTFTLTLPTVVPQAGPSLAAAPDQSGTLLKDLRILIADDEQDARDAAAALLFGLGAHVVTAASGMEALAMLQEEPFDGLVCDIAMPGMDGYALIAQIRGSSNPKVAGLPAIALSAYAMRQDRVAAIEAGFQAHVAKPVSMQRLVNGFRDAMPQLPAI